MYFSIKLCFRLFVSVLSYVHSSACEIPIIRLSGSELTKEYIENSGFNLPILIDKKDGLDLKVPPSNFSIQDVENYVGKLL